MRGFHRGWASCAALALDPFDPRMLWVGTGGQFGLRRHAEALARERGYLLNMNSTTSPSCIS